MEITLDIGYPSNLLYSDVSISVPDHGIISFVGDNGCGKSTLLKTLAGIINPMIDLSMHTFGFSRER